MHVSRRKINFIDPQLLHNLHASNAAPLKRIESYQLLTLILEDVRDYPQAKISEIQQRMGSEIPRSRIRRALKQLVKDGKLYQKGTGSATRYRLL